MAPRLEAANMPESIIAMLAETPLMLLIKAGNLHCFEMETLIQGGADVNAHVYGVTPLMALASKNFEFDDQSHAEATQTLINEGANLNAQTMTRGETVLMQLSPNGVGPIGLLSRFFLHPGQM